MSTAQFQIVFNGPAVKDGEIDVRELTASLTAMNQLFDEADAILNGGRTTHALKVKGSFKTGSFKVMFASQQGAITAAKQWLLGEDATAISNAEAILGLLFVGVGGGYSLWKLLKWLKGQKVTKILEEEDGSFAIYRGEKFVKIEERVLKLYQDFKVRQAFEEAIAEPLKPGKIDSVAVTDDKGKTFVEAKLSEKTFYTKMPEQSAMLPSRHFEMDVSIVRLSFESPKWTVYDGIHTLNVDLEDKEFLARIGRDEESFSKGDILRVMMRVDQSETSSGLKAKHSIERVLAHRRPAFKGQLRLDLQDGK